MKHMGLLETSDEFIFQKYNNGIKLIRPDNKVEPLDERWTVKSIFKLPLNIGFLDTQSVIQNINENTIKVSGYHSVKDAIGSTVRIASKKESAEYSINHDKEVIKANKQIIREEHYVRSVDDIAFQAITFKLPWYGNDNKIIGVFFCAFAINGVDALPLTETLTLVSKIGLLNNDELRHYNTDGLRIFKKFDIYFSKREMECIYLLIRGKTSKMIAKELNLSYRTVEHYLENIKIKLNVSTKAALVEKIIDECLQI